MAEAIAKHAAKERGLGGFDVGSAGIAAQEGQPASRGALRAMEARGLSLEGHRARLLTPELAKGADLILTMTVAHARAVRQIAPGANVFALRGYLGESGDVADPWGGPDEEYALCARELERLVSQAVKRWADRS